MPKPSDDQDLWDASLAWYIQCSAAALGEKGTLQSTVNQLEHGGPAVTGTDFAPSDAQLGWSAHGEKRESSPARARRCERIWRTLSLDHRLVLVAHYGSGAALRARGVIARLGPLAGAAMAIHEGRELAGLLKACDRGDESVIRSARNRAERAVRQSHRAWRDARRAQAEAWAEAT